MGAETIIEQILVRFGVDTSQLNSQFAAAKGNTINLLNTLASLAGVTLTAGAAIRAVGDYARASMEDYSGLATQTRDLSLLTGMEATEASTLIQVFDALQIDARGVETALQYASRNGFNPTIENMMALGDQYRSIQDPTERAQLLFDTFGRSGESLARFLSEDRDRLAEVIDGVQRTALVMDEEGVAAYDRYYESVGFVNDRLTELRLRFAEGVVIPVVVSIVDVLERNYNVSDMLNQYFADQSTQLVNLTDDWYAYAQAAAWAYDPVAALSGATYDFNQLAEQGVIMSQRQFEAHYAMRDAIEAHDEALAGLVDEEGNYIGTLETITDSFNELTAAQLYNRVAQNLDSEAALGLARQMGLLNDASYAAYSYLDSLNQQLQDGTISADEYEDRATDLAIAIQSLQDRHVTITVDVIENVTRNDWAYTGGASSTEAAARVFHWGSAGTEARAEGGDTEAFTPYWVGEQGPELVVPRQNGTVIPSDESSRIAGLFGGGSGYGGPSAREIGYETAIQLQRLGGLG
jgi:hypothetical protein